MGSRGILPAWSLPGLLLVLCGPSGSPFELWTEPEVLVVEHGGSLRLTLRATCNDSGGSGGIETANRKRTRQIKPGEVEVELLEVTEAKSNPFVYYTCHGRREKKDVRLVVYQVPQRPELAEVPPLAAGQPWELLCAVAGAAPLQNLTVRLRSGRRVLSARSFQGDGRDGPGEARVTHGVTPGARDDGQNVTCEAQLDLSPFGPDVTVTSEPRTLRVSAGRSALSPLVPVGVVVLVGAVVGAAALPSLLARSTAGCWRGRNCAGGARGDPSPETGGDPPPDTGGDPPPNTGGDPPPDTGGDPPPDTGGDPPPDPRGDPPPDTGGDPPPDTGETPGEPRMEILPPPRSRDGLGMGNNPPPGGGNGPSWLECPGGSTGEVGEEGSAGLYWAILTYTALY